MTKFVPICAVALVFALGGCAQLSRIANRDGGAPAPDAAASAAGAAPEAPAAAPPEVAPETPEEVQAVVSAPPPAAGANTAAALDTVSDEQKAAAQSVTEGGNRLGEVTASLGDPTEGGLWVKTALVSSTQPGRIENPANGQSGLVELRPGDGGTTLSLSTMRLLEIPLTDIPTVVIYSQ